MTRSQFRRIWLISFAIMFGAGMYAYNQYQQVQMEIDRKMRLVERLTVERRSGSQLTSALAELDSRTIDENNATRLDILRYLGLEESRLVISVTRPLERRVGTTTVVSRDVNISGSLPYEEALNQLDYFYNTKKISIHYVAMNIAGDSEYGDTVNFTLRGVMYGLNK